MLSVKEDNPKGQPLAKKALLFEKANDKNFQSDTYVVGHGNGLLLMTSLFQLPQGHSGGFPSPNQSTRAEPEGEASSS